MKFLWYFLTLISGAIVLLGAARVVERFAKDVNAPLVQIGIVIIFIFLTAQFLQRARARG